MTKRTGTFFLCAAFLCLPFPHASFGARLPGYEDFRRVDRVRRLTGQLNTMELLEVTRLDIGLITATAQQHANDAQILFGAAELLGDWSVKRSYFEQALAASRTNSAVAIRFAFALAQNREFDAALPLFRASQKEYSGNLAASLAELWILRQQKKTADKVGAASSWASQYRDFGAEAARARIGTLEAAGYSPYAARRLGFMPDAHLLNMARELSQPPIEKETTPLLVRIARAMQDRPTFLLTELVGQTLERAVLTVGVEGQSQAETSYRYFELDRRREQLKTLLADVEQHSVDLATEAEMIEYFDNVLATGEENAMKRLAETVRHQPVAK